MCGEWGGGNWRAVVTLNSTERNRPVLEVFFTHPNTLTVDCDNTTHSARGLQAETGGNTNREKHPQTQPKGGTER